LGTGLQGRVETGAASWNQGYRGIEKIRTVL
jgi:hypothetical protein